MDGWTIASAAGRPASTTGHENAIGETRMGTTMDQRTADGPTPNALTPLERELLRSVEALSASSAEESSSLRASLKRYAIETSDATERRLKAIEARQANIEGLVRALSEQLNSFAEQSTRSEASVTALKRELSTFAR